jgi:hypothetical protein
METMTGSANRAFEGMTLNERLIAADQLVVRDAAVAARDRREIVRILRMLSVADPDKVAGEVLGSS